MENSNISRRRIVGLLGALPVIGVAGSVASKAEMLQSGARTVTPRQTEGPFYPRTKPADIDNNLTLVGQQVERATGEQLELLGRVVDRHGNHISGAKVEIWHCDHLGVYHHVGLDDTQDEHFQGYGETRCDGEGKYRFLTVQPGLYPGRTRHIHFKVFAEGHRTLTSQLYFEQDMQANLRDGIYRRLSSAEKKAVTMQANLVSGGEGRSGFFEIVVA